jgi:hypothetical protein
MAAILKAISRMMRPLTRKHPVFRFVGWICLTVFVSLSCWLDLFIGFEMLEFDGFAVDGTDSTRWSREFMV